jgi:serine/threonine protein kinase
MASSTPCSDLKSANCLLKSSPRTPHDLRGFTVKIADFGSARVIGDTVALSANPAMSKTGTGVTGTGCDAGGGAPLCQAALSHAAPELVAGETASKAADIWSLGVVLWELVTGKC